jgi:hypothetical protein
MDVATSDGRVGMMGDHIATAGIGTADGHTATAGIGTTDGRVGTTDGRVGTTDGRVGTTGGSETFFLIVLKAALYILFLASLGRAKNSRIMCSFPF